MSGGRGGNSSQKKLAVADRRRQVAQIIANTPRIRYRDVAEMLDVSTKIIEMDVQYITAEWQSERLGLFEFYLSDQLSEYEKLKNICYDRLSKLTKPTQGARWVEMVAKCLDSQAKLLGLYAPEKHALIAIDAQNKDQKDALVKAVLASYQTKIPGLLPEPEMKRISMEVKAEEDDVIEIEDDEDLDGDYDDADGPEGSEEDEEVIDVEN